MRSFAQIRGAGQKAAPGCCACGEHLKAGLQALNPLNIPDWNDAISGRPDAWVFHTTEWAQILLETYRWQPFYHRLGEGVFPLIEARSWPQRPRGVCLPFSDFCAPLAPDSESVRSWFDNVVEIGRTRGWKYIELRGGLGLLGDRVMASEEYYGHELDLQLGAERVFAGFEGSVRQAIRKSGRLGVVVSLGTDIQSLRDFWALHVQTRRRHGVPPQPWRFMLKIHEHLISQGKGLIAVARAGKEAIAACVFLHSGRKALFKFGASDVHAQESRGMNAAFWSAVQYYAENGFTGLHLGRTDMENAGLRRFKLGWGAAECVIRYCRYDLERGEFIAQNRGGCSSFSRRIFRCMPTPLFKAAGALLYRHAG